MNTSEKQDLKSLYGKEYVDAFENNQSQQRIAKLQQYMDLKASDHVLDVGCGNGMLMHRIAPLVGSYTGVDFSEEFIKAAQQAQDRAGLQNVTFVCESITNFCIAHSACYDKAFALDLSEHIYDEEWLSILASLRTALKAGGHLYLHTPDAGFVIERMKARNLILKQFPEHVAVRSLKHNISLLQQAGFRIHRARRLPHYVRLLRPLHLLSYIPGTGSLFKARIFIDCIC
jgi:cyclopropane fatty-acyl-phospholipid synthase-like methyltransferase